MSEFILKHTPLLLRVCVTGQFICFVLMVFLSDGPLMALYGYAWFAYTAYQAFKA